MPYLLHARINLIFFTYRFLAYYAIILASRMHCCIKNPVAATEVHYNLKIYDGYDGCIEHYNIKNNVYLARVLKLKTKGFAKHKLPGYEKIDLDERQ